MGIKFKNNAFGTLSAGIIAGDLTINLTAGHGARFPSLSAGDYFYSTLIDASGNLEIVKVTARATDALTVVRAQDGTSARAYSTLDRLELRPCNAGVLALAQEANVAYILAGTNVYTATLAPVPTAYNLDQVYPVYFTNGNTADAPTVNFNAFGAKTIIHRDGSTVKSGDIPANFFALLGYDGTSMVLLNAVTNEKTQTLTDGATITFDLSLGKIAKCTMLGTPRTVSITNLRDGSFVLHLIQDATGSRVPTITGAKWPLGVAAVFSTGANARDIVSFTVENGVIYASLMKGMA